MHIFLMVLWWKASSSFKLALLPDQFSPFYEAKFSGVAKHSFFVSREICFDFHMKFRAPATLVALTVRDFAPEVSSKKKSIVAPKQHNSLMKGMNSVALSSNGAVSGAFKQVSLRSAEPSSLKSIKSLLSRCSVPMTSFEFKGC